jgi:hypothetical protein
MVVSNTSNHSRLVHGNIDPIIKATLSRRLLFGIIVYLIAIGISSVYIQLSLLFFTLALTPAFLPDKLIHTITFVR